jgi:hypothetical protein
MNATSPRFRLGDACTCFTQTLEVKEQTGDEARRLRLRVATATDAYRALKARQSSEDFLQGRLDGDAVAFLDGT